MVAMDKTDIINIDILKLIKALWKKLWLIVLMGLIGGFAGFAYSSYYLEPLYVADTEIYVNNSSFSLGSTSFSISSGDLSAAQSLVDTYIVILNSRSTIMDIIDEADLPYSYGVVRSMISAGAVSGTEIFKVTVTTNDPEMSVTIANTIAKVLPDRIAEVVDGSSVRIVDYAVMPNYKSGPNITRYTAIGIVGAMILTCGFVILLTLLDSVIHDEDFLTERYADIPVLAVIPDLNESGSRRSYGYYRSY